MTSIRPIFSFFDVMQVCVRVVYTQRVLLCGDVIAQCQVKLVQTVVHSGNRGDGVVRLSFCFCIDEGFLIGIASPGLKDVVRQINDPVFIISLETDDRERPLYNAGFDILEAFHLKCADYRRFCHCKGVITALEMVMAQNGAAYDRQVGVGTKKIVWK